jgi:hypothetical protein
MSTTKREFKVGEQVIIVDSRSHWNNKRVRIERIQRNIAWVCLENKPSDTGWFSLDFIKKLDEFELLKSGDRVRIQYESGNAWNGLVGIIRSIDAHRYYINLEEPELVKGDSITFSGTRWYPREALVKEVEPYVREKKAFQEWLAA